MAYNRGYSNNRSHLPNGSSHGPQQSTSHNVLQTDAGRILCIADIRGHLSDIASLVQKTKASCVLHVGDFGFYDSDSAERMTEKTLKHVVQYSPILSEQFKISIAQSSEPVKSRFANGANPLSELPSYIAGKLTLPVPVYVISGACEDVRVLEGFRAGMVKVHNLNVVDESKSALVTIGGIKLRILGLGGAVVMHKLFDNGEGRTTIAGGGGTMWTTMLQIGELLDTAHRVFDPTEVRIFMTHACPAREGVISQLAVELKSDFTISGGLHFRYSTSFNEFSVNPSMDQYCSKLAAARASFMDVWETVRAEVEPAVKQNESQRRLLDNALNMVSKMPSSATNSQTRTAKVEDSAFKNIWGFNLCDAAYGHTLLHCSNGRVAVEMEASGFNFNHRLKSPAAPAGANHSQTPYQPSPATQTPFNDTPSAPAQFNNQSSTSTPNAAMQNHRNSSYGQARNQGQPRGAPQTNMQSSGQSIAPAPQQQRTPGTGQSDSSKPSSLSKATAGPQGLSSPQNGQASATTPGVAGAPGANRVAPVLEKPTNGLFVQNVKDEDQIRALFSDDDRSKIKSIDIRGHSKPSGPFAFVKFESLEEAQAVLDRQPAERKRASNRDRNTPHLKILMERPSGPLPERHSYRGAGQWNARDGNTQNNPTAPAEGTPAANLAQNAGGYKTGSDSETARGGRGGRVGRGGRAGMGGRGGRGGRGGHAATNSNGGSNDGAKSSGEGAAKPAKEQTAKANSGGPAATPAAAGAVPAGDAKK